MRYISKKTKIILIVIAIVGIIAGGVLGFLSGMNYANLETNKNSVPSGKITRTNENITKSSQVDATNDQEFVNYIKNTSVIFSDKSCSSYIVNYNKLKFEVTGKASVESSGYNIQDLKIYYEDKLISKELLNKENSLGYSNVFDVLSLASDKTNVFILIMNLITNDVPINYIIAFTSDGKVLLNDENPQKNYFISSSVVENKEVKQFGYNYKLYPELYKEEVDQTTCSNEFIDKVKEAKDEDIILAKRVYEITSGELKETELEKKTIKDEKTIRKCKS